MTLYDISVAVTGVSAILGAIIAARSMKPGRVHYLDRVTFGQKNEKLTSEVIKAEAESPILAVKESTRERIEVENLRRVMTKTTQTGHKRFGQADALRTLLNHAELVRNHNEHAKSDTRWAGAERTILIKQPGTMQFGQGHLLGLISEQRDLISKQAEEVKRHKLAIDELEMRVRFLEEGSDNAWVEKTIESAQMENATKSIHLVKYA